jgi:hypothetical protein
LSGGELTRAEKDGKKHGTREAAGVGVLERGVVAGDRVEAVGERELGGVGEGET